MADFKELIAALGKVSDAFKTDAEDDDDREQDEIDTDEDTVDREDSAE